MTDDVVITGLGVVSPIGCDERSYWEGLCGGRCGAAEVEGFDTSELTRKMGCQVRASVPEERVSGRATKLALWAGRQALASAGIGVDEASSARCSLVLGTTMGETEFIEGPLFGRGQGELSDEQMTEVVRYGPGVIAEQVKDALGLCGPAAELYGACAAGNMALGMARQHLREGRCDFALVGGADGFSFLAFVGFMRARIMAAEKVRPFDVNRDGMMVGEGACMMVLERAETARARGATARARVAGCGISAESYHPTRPDPEGRGLSQAIRLALEDAGVSPEEVDYVNAHGTGTTHNDAIEVKVLMDCFPQGVPFSSTKAVMGHTMGAASALEAACCLLSLEEQKLVPTWHLIEPMETGALEPLMGTVREAKCRYALNNSAGFGGYNSAVVLAK
jgi:3-oxoacyl-[acyl-carrier-protein] synthase II